MGLGTTMASKRKKSVPVTLAGMDGKFELGERRVADPLNPGTLVAVAVNVRESSIDWMASRGRLNSAQVAAADRFRRIWELAAVGRARGISFDSFGRSSGAISDPLTDALVEAGRDLAKVMKQLTLVHSWILVALVGEGKTIKTVAKAWSDSNGNLGGGARAEGYITGTLIDAIDELVRLWRAEGIGHPPRMRGDYGRNSERVSVRDAIRASGPLEETGPAHEISIGRLGDMVVDSKRPMENKVGHVAGNVGKRGK